MTVLPPIVETATSVVWDFDGVIADTEPAQALAYETLLNRRGIHVPSGWFHDYVGTPEVDIWSQLKRHYRVADDVASLMLERSDVFVNIGMHLKPAWFAHDVLSLPCPHRIVSAGQLAHIEALMHAWGLDGAFASVSASRPIGEPGGLPKRDRLAQAAERGAVLFEDMPAYLNLDLGFATGGGALLQRPAPRAERPSRETRRGRRLAQRAHDSRRRSAASWRPRKRLTRAQA